MENQQILLFDATEICNEPLDKSMGGKPRRILGGYAAGTTRDFQNEKVIMDGVDFSYLSSNQGRINWDHTPLIIGKPLAVGMLEKGLYAKGVLSEKSDYPNPTHPDTLAALDRAEWAWDYAQRHKANPEANPPLAWSVQGKKMNMGMDIVKSIVTEIALTDKAVNPTDCTVSAMAKSLREQLESGATKAVTMQSGLTAEEISHEMHKIKDHETMLKFGKSIGLSAGQTINYYHIIRGL